MIRLDVLRSALDWLLVGYPDGIPAKDYSPVLALLRRQQLTEEEVGYVAARLVDRAVDSPNIFQHVTREDVEREIAALTHEQPEEADVQRVARQLGSLASPTDEEDQTAQATL